MRRNVPWRRCFFFLQSVAGSRFIDHMQGRSVGGLKLVDEKVVGKFAAPRNSRTRWRRVPVQQKNIIIIYYYYYYYFYPRYSIPSELKKTTLCNTKKYKNQAGMNLSLLLLLLHKNYYYYYCCHKAAWWFIDFLVVLSPAGMLQLSCPRSPSSGCACGRRHRHGLLCCISSRERRERQTRPACARSRARSMADCSA